MNYFAQFILFQNFYKFQIFPTLIFPSLAFLQSPNSHKMSKIYVWLRKCFFFYVTHPNSDISNNNLCTFPALRYYYYLWFCIICTTVDQKTILTIVWQVSFKMASNDLCLVFTQLCVILPPSVWFGFINTSNEWNMTDACDVPSKVKLHKAYKLHLSSHCISQVHTFWKGSQLPYFVLQMGLYGKDHGKHLSSRQGRKGPQSNSSQGLGTVNNHVSEPQNQTLFQSSLQLKLQPQVLV